MAPDDPFAGLGDMPHDPFSSFEDRPPPTGGSPPKVEHQCVPFCPICRTADVIRAAAPPEFQEHWQAFSRACAPGKIGQRSAEAAVEDIPIE